MAPTTETLLALASALPLIIFGAGLLWLRPRRSENVFFALFAIGWGLQVGFVNASRLTTDTTIHDALFVSNIVLALPTAFFLAYFASIHPRRNFVARHAWGPSLLLAGVLPGLVVLVARPGLILGETLVDGRAAFSVYRPGIVPLIVAPFFGAFYYALLTQLRAARREPRDVAAQRARMVALALAPFIAYHSTLQLFAWVAPPPPLTFQPLGVRLPNAILFGAGVLIILAYLAAMVLRWRKTGDLDRPLFLALALPVAFAVVERVLAEFGLGFETLPLWRIAMVAMAVYAISRYQLFDLDLRLRRAFAASLVPAAAASTLVLVVALYLGGQPLPVVAAVCGVGLLVNVAAWRSRERLRSILLPASAGDPDYLYHRKLEVYRVELDRLLAKDSSLDSEGPRLRRLRSEMGITEREHQVLEYVARSSIGRDATPLGRPVRAEPGALVAGRYRVERLLGEGAHGRAYLAHDEREDRRVVVKSVGSALFDPRAARLLMREARIISKIHHPNVVELYDAVEAPQESLLVMEYCDGGSLYGLLRRRTRLPPSEAARILEGILRGLEAAHARGIVHRDLKPENLLLKADGTVKIADFGVAREARPDATVGATEIGVAGTLLYMSPEQVRGGPADARSDLYSAAVVYHQLLTGRFYVQTAGLDDFQIRQRILRSSPRLDAGPASSFLARALAKDPARRFQSAAQMRAALGNLSGLRKNAEASASHPTPGAEPV